jgi:cytochrome P450
MTDPIFDPFDFAVHADPYPFYRRLRDDHPAYWSTGAQCWVLSRHADVFAALHDWPHFSNAGGNVIDDSKAKIGRTVGSVDPPRHTRLRALVNEAFNRRQVAKQDAFIEATAARLIEAQRGRARFDLVRDVTSPLAGEVMAQLLGVEGTDFAQFKRLIDLSMFRDPVTRSRTPEGEAAQAELFRLVAAQVARRQHDPGEDMISALLRIEIEGERLEEESAVWMARAVFGAGFESTSSFLANSVLALIAHPAAREELAADAALIPDAVEEFLRWETPAQRFARVIGQPIELHGQAMQPGQKVMLLYGSANRDERAFPQPDVLDIRRRPRMHLGLGHGIHFCAGAALARSVARIFLARLLEALPPLARAEDGPIDWAHSPTFRSPVSLPVRPAAA